MPTDKKEKTSDSHSFHITTLSTMQEKSEKEILIVEDSHTQSECIKHLLIKAGYTVRTAKNGAEGLKMVQAQKPALIISDIVMPVMDGYTLCKEIKQHNDFKDIPVILLTQLNNIEDIIQGLSVGADEYITKPYLEKELLFKVDSSFNGRDQEKATREILIVEDSPTQAELLECTLTNRGYKVSVAKDGIEALEVVQKRKPALIISDIIMPRMDGHELCHEIKRDKTLKDIPILLLTCLTRPEDVIRSLNARVDGYITKPYDENFLLTKVESLLIQPNYSKTDEARKDFTFTYRGKKYVIAANRYQILNLFLSAYEHLIEQNSKFLKIEVELKKLNEQLEERVHERTALLEEISAKDILTGLLNRYTFDRDQKDFKNPILILVNIDNFKLINDFYGIETGDYILQRLSPIIKSLIPTDLHAGFYRLGADDFGILYEHTLEQNPEDLAKILIHEVGKEIFIFQGNDILISISIAISRERPLLEKANMVLRYIKKRPRIKFLEYHKELNLYENVSRNLNVINLLKHAIERDDILVYFQPILNNRTGKINKYECLVRVSNKNGEILTPASFLHIVKETKLYADITETMIKKSISMVKNTPYEFSINLSIGDIMDKRFNNFMREIFHYNREIAKRITFEILESEGIENYQVVHDFIHEMKEYGCKMAIDDFGAGYSNFEHILRLDVNYLKIDSSLIKNIDADIYSQIIVETIVNFVKKLEIEIIAEFVHSERVHQKVKALGVDYSQGYYIGEPKPVTG